MKSATFSSLAFVTQVVPPGEKFGVATRGLCRATHCSAPAPEIHRSTVLPTLDRWWHRFVLLLPPPFKDIAVELRRIVPRWLKSRTLLDIEVLGDTLRRTFGDYTFQEAFERTGRIINITVVPNNSTDFPRCALNWPGYNALCL